MCQKNENCKNQKIVIKTIWEYFKIISIIEKIIFFIGISIFPSVLFITFSLNENPLSLYELLIVSFVLMILTFVLEIINYKEKKYCFDINKENKENKKLLKDIFVVCGLMILFIAFGFFLLAREYTFLSMFFFVIVFFIPILFFVYDEKKSLKIEESSV